MAAWVFSYFWLATLSASGAPAGASPRPTVRPAEWGGAALALASAAVMLRRKRLYRRASSPTTNGDDAAPDRVADGLPADSEANTPLSQALDLMGRAIEDGREAFHEWRFQQGLPPELPEALSRVPETAVGECSGRPSFRVLCEGSRKPLAPAIEDEIYRIGREAVLNAFRHSRARNIEVSLKFRPDSLRVVVRDDGCGITPELVARSRDANRGLAAMRDKAEKIGARLRLRSAPQRGTELELSVPGVFTM
jgi:signal transduction histidine kinase